MTYLMTSNHDGDLATFRRIAEQLDAQTAGLVARYAGENEHGLAITSVWESKAACDRFTAEHLVPALKAVLGDPLPPSRVSVFVGFEAVDEYHPVGASSPGAR